LTRIKHLGDIEDFNLDFQVLAIRVDDISVEHLLEAYVGGLKKDIKCELFLGHPTNIVEVMQFSHHIQAMNKATHKSTLEHTQGAKIVLRFIRQVYLNQQG
jgi:hypothetical protein